MAFTILAVNFKSKQLPAQRRLTMTFVSAGHHRYRMIYVPMAPWQFLAEHGLSDWHSLSSGRCPSSTPRAHHPTLQAVSAAAAERQAARAHQAGAIAAQSVRAADY
jgi:hypothetical protein